MPSPGYSFSAPEGGHQPYVYYSATGVAPGFAVAVPLDDVFSTAPGGDVVAAPYFTLTAASAPFAYQVVVDPSIWTSFTQAPIRADVRASFDAFLLALDGQSLRPGRLGVIRGWLAQVLPQTFAESLYFRHGLDRAGRCVELTPGMRLRIDFQAHQAIDPATDPLNGFVGSGSSYVTLTEVPAPQGGLALGFDPFLTQLQGLTLAAAAGGGGGAIDLQGVSSTLPYWRLLYPQNYPSSDGTGFVGPQGNVTLLGAQTRAVLESATTAYQGAKPLPSNAVALWFRGRASVVPEVPVLVQGELRHVPLGSTVRDLLSGLAPMPRLRTPVAFISQGFERPMTVLSGKAPQQTPIWQPLNYQQQNPQYTVNLGTAWYGDTLDTFDLPVLGGDSLSIPVQASG